MDLIFKTLVKGGENVFKKIIIPVCFEKACHIMG